MTSIGPNRKILVFEYITGGGLQHDPLPSSLAREGEIMRNALLRDLADIPGIQPVAMLDERLLIAKEWGKRVQWRTVPRDVSWRECYRLWLPQCDAVWPIAPETDGLLESLCRQVEDSGIALLTSPAEAVRIAASKLATHRRLCAAGIPTVATVPASVDARHSPLVVKPDDGVGCEGTRVFENTESLSDWMERTDEGNRHVLQPLIEGESLSLSALFGRGEARLLTVNRQDIVRDGDGFRLLGCEVNALREDLAGFEELAARIARAMPELWGYAGIDLIRDDQGLHVLEINPRLTTSYAGIHPATGINPAECVLELFHSGKLPRIEANSGRSIEIRMEPLRHED